MTQADRRRAGRAILVGLASLGLVVVTWVAMVRTVAGQRFGDQVYDARFVVRGRARAAADGMLDGLTSRSLLVAGLVIMGIALARRRPRLALAAGVIVFGTAVVAQLLKRGLDRPDLGVDPPGLGHNTMPSGHASMSMALALALVVVLPGRWRIAGAIAGFLWASAMAAGTLAAGWHRPADTFSGEFLAFGIAALVVAALIAWRGGTGRAAPIVRSPWLRTGLVVAVAAVPVIVFLGFALGPAHDAALAPGRPDFIAASVLTVLLAAVLVRSFLGLLAEVDLDPVGAARPGGA